ncbi:MAG: hypothetical protein QXT91_00780 [Candidatus Caldarchaeum sp.]
MEDYAVLISQQDWQSLCSALEELYRAEDLLEAVESRLGQMDDQAKEWFLRALVKLVNARERLESVLGL